MTRLKKAAQIEKRAANLKKLLGMLTVSERQAFERHFADDLEEAKVAADILRNPNSNISEDGLFTGPCENRYLLLYWTEYDNQFDDINPDDWETKTDSERQARELVEQHICRNEPTDYAYRCRVFDLDAGVELRWHEVREIRWTDAVVPEVDEPTVPPPVEPAEEDVDEENLVWVPALPQGEYHWLRQPADEPDVRTDKTRTATVACGTRILFEAQRADSVPLGDKPYSHSGWCQGCLDAMKVYKDETYAPKEKKPARLHTLWWGQTNVGVEKTWHAFLTEPVKLPREKSTIHKHFKMQKYVGDAVCGSAIQTVGVTDMPLGDNPHPGEKSRLCLNCMDRVTRLRIDNQ